MQAFFGDALSLLLHRAIKHYPGESIVTAIIGSTVGAWLWKQLFGRS